MSVDWHSFIADAGQSASGWLTPGRVLKAFARGPQVSSDVLGPLTPAGPGCVTAQVPASLAASVRTPLPVRVDDGIITIRREDDRLALERTTLDAPVQGTLPPAGQVTAAIAAALGDGYGSEDVGLTLDGASRLILDLPPMSEGRLPGSLVVGDATIDVDAARTHGKKNG